MKVILFGATGMVGCGVLRECLLDPDVEAVLSVARGTTGQRHAKLREIRHMDFLNFAPIAAELTGYDACFYCLGISSVGMAEEKYTHITYDMTMAAAEALVKVNPAMTFIYVTGAGTDSTERGRSMWARVKGRTENALLRLPFRAAYMFRPGAIQPLHGIRSKTWLYQLPIDLLAPIFPFLLKRFPQYVTTTERVGRGMLRVVKYGCPKHVLESTDINNL